MVLYPFADGKQLDTGARGSYATTRGPVISCGVMPSGRGLDGNRTFRGLSCYQIKRRNTMFQLDARP